MCIARNMGDYNGMQELETPDIGDGEENISEEYENLNSTLDQLESCLDMLEQQNDSLFAKLQELLDESKQDQDDITAVPEAHESTENDKLDHTEKTTTASVPCSSTSISSEPSSVIPNSKVLQSDSIDSSLADEAMDQ